MWQLTQEREERQRQEQRDKEAQAGDVLSIEPEGEAFRSVLVVSRLVDGSFLDAKVRGPRRAARAEAVQDGLQLRATCRAAPEAEREAAVRKRCRELQASGWRPEELPPEDTSVEEKREEPMRQRLAAKPRGHGWQRVGDKELFRHSHAPMVFDSKKRRYMLLDEASNTYSECGPPHDPQEHPVVVSASASMVGRTDEDVTAPNRPRTLLLKELIKTGAAMKNPLFFLDSPAACFALFDGVRGGTAAEWCSKHFHTKLLPRLSASLTYWSDAAVRELLSSILEELDAQLLQQPGACWDGVSVAVALLLGGRLAVASLGSVRVVLLPPGGSCRLLGGEHDGRCAAERQRVEAGGGEVTGTDGAAMPLVRKPLRPREWEAAEGRSPEEEVRRIVSGASDAFAALCLEPGEDPGAADGKAARSSYKRLALRVHPDKVPLELKERAKEAFEKAETAAAAIEAFCEADAEAAAAMHRVLHAAGATGQVMTRAGAASLLGVTEDAPVEDVRRRAAELREHLPKLGMRADGSFAYPEQERTAWILDEAVEAFLAPPMKEEGIAALEAVQATRALGLRDLKLPRPLLLAKPQVDIVQLEQEGTHHLALLNCGAAVLSDQEVFDRVRTFAKQPKAASLLVAADAAARNASAGAAGLARFASCMVGVFDVGAGAGAVEPAAKRPRKDGAGEKVRARHILLKHRELKMKMDAQAHLRQKGPVTRPLAQAERELLRLKEALAADPKQFHLLARKHSECQSALQPGQLAGDLGWVSRGSLGDPAFEELILGLEVHEMSDLVSTPRGVHIVHRYA